jgi:serine phosphatase RsbU (regulator of sigma subunit)
MNQVKQLLFFFLFAGLMQQSFAQFSPEEQKQIDSLNAIIVNSASHDTSLASAYVALSNIVYVSNLDTIIPLCERAISIARRSLNKYSERKIRRSLYNSIAGSLNNIGFIYSNKGDIPKALEYYHLSLKVAEKTGDKQGIATSLNNIGPIYYYQGDILQALEYYHRSLKIKEEIGDKKGIAYSLNNIGSIYLYQKETTKALDYFHRGLKIREEIGDKQGIAYSLSNIGFAYQDLGNHEKGREYFLQSLKIVEEIGDKISIAHALHDIGNAYLEEGKMIAAESYAKRSLALSKELGFPENIRNAAQLLYKTYEKQRMGMEALEMHKLFIQMRDSLSNEETQKATLKELAKYEYEKQKAISDKEHEKQMAVAAEQEKKQKIISYSIGTGLVMMLLFSFVLFNRLQLTRKQKVVIEHQKKEVEAKHKEITDSIFYAKRIQDSILPSRASMREHLKDEFLLFQPKDVVAGDFYWMEPSGDSLYFAVADCTGHGVPGAMVSVVCSYSLSKALLEENITQTGKLLDRTRELVIERFAKSGEEVNDGMDISLCALNMKTRQLQWSGANNPLWRISKGEMIKYRPNKQPIGRYEEFELFATHDIQLEKDDIIYLFSDGYADQFGGPNGKKFMSQRLNDLLLSIASKPMGEQKKILKRSFEDWKIAQEQVDDVCIIGVRV